MDRKQAAPATAGRGLPAHPHPSAHPPCPPSWPAHSPCPPTLPTHPPCPPTLPTHPHVSLMSRSSECLLLTPPHFCPPTLPPTLPCPALPCLLLTLLTAAHARPPLLCTAQVSSSLLPPSAPACPPPSPICSPPPAPATLPRSFLPSPAPTCSA